MFNDTRSQLNLAILTALAADPQGLELSDIALDAAGGAEANWAAAELQQAGLVELTGEGRMRLTPAGLAIAGRDLQSRGAAQAAGLAQAFLAADEELAKLLLARAYGLSPACFETLIVELLQAMGYGGGKPELARRIGRSGDGGIDGIINADSLGLDAIYVQAKRYRPGDTVPLTELRDFAGSLDAQRASKGVFLTTARFTPAAHEFVRQSSCRIVLVDGRKLAGLMLQFQLGVKVQAVFELKRLNDSYFEALPGLSRRTAAMSSASAQPRR